MCIVTGSCQIRGLTGFHIGSNDSILGRLSKLKHAVFGSVGSAGASTDQVPVGIKRKREGRRTTTCHREDPNLAHAALILSVTATSAFFHNKSSRSLDLFASAKEAAQAALSWLKSALNILEKSWPTDSSCLEEVQARSMLSYLVYNIEGCSACFRFLYSCLLVTAQEICLHLLNSLLSVQQWHIASTDWMLGLIGRPTNRTYNVQPRQINVRYPHNINDNKASLLDKTFTMPPDTATALSCFIKRIQLAKIARSIIDARVPGVPDAKVINYDKVLKLNSLFENAFADFPSFLRPDGPIPTNTPHYLALQRDVILFSFHSQRARLHRPFLLHNKQDAHYRPSQETCLQSACIVLSIATSLFQASKDEKVASALEARAIGCQLGCVISHMFMACTILALNARLDPSQGVPAAGEGRNLPSSMTAESHAEVAQACRTLASAGEESAVAENLVRNLVTMLRRYRIRVIDDVISSDSEHATTSGAEFPNNALDNIAKSNKKTVRSNGDHNTSYPVMLGKDNLSLHRL
ncbi:hypothetical protein LZ30DRAFT_743523 [Colletotrichum cereale]|nr:hypothetical protein LZ30DRAFT_743523 [Colletotrichum cereale]